MSDITKIDRKAQGLSNAKIDPMSLSVSADSGELIQLDNYGPLPTYGNIGGVDKRQSDPVVSIGGDGEITPYTKATGTLNRSAINPIFSQVAVGVITAVIAAIIVIAVTRRRK